jgi:hypothetical protein
VNDFAAERRGNLSLGLGISLGQITALLEGQVVAQDRVRAGLYLGQSWPLPVTGVKSVSFLARIRCGPFNKLPGFCEPLFHHL